MGQQNQKGATMVKKNSPETAQFLQYAKPLPPVPDEANSHPSAQFSMEEMRAQCGDHMIYSNDMKPVNVDDFDVLKVIGKGQFAKVRKFLVCARGENRIKIGRK